MSFLDWVEQQEDNNRVVKPINGGRLFIAIDAKGGQVCCFEWFFTGTRENGKEQGKYETVLTKLSERFGWNQ